MINRASAKLCPMSEIVFEVREDEVEGGYIASALGYGIHTQGDTLEELRSMVKEAVDCYFDESIESPKVIRIHFIRDELIARCQRRTADPSPSKAGLRCYKATIVMFRQSLSRAAELGTRKRQPPNAEDERHLPEATLPLNCLQ